MKLYDRSVQKSLKRSGIHPYSRFIQAQRTLEGIPRSVEMLGASALLNRRRYAREAVIFFTSQTSSGKERLTFWTNQLSMVAAELKARGIA